MHWKKAKSDYKTHHFSFMKYMATFGEPLLKPHAHNHSRSTQFLISTPVTLTQTPPSHPMHGHITHLFFSSSFHLHYFIPIRTIKSSNTQLTRSLPYHFSPSKLIHTHLIYPAVTTLISPPCISAKLKKCGSDIRYLATVLAIGIECGIALLTVNDDEFRDGV